MKIATSLLAVLLFTGTLGALNDAIAENDILFQDESTASSYGHEKFSAAQPSTPDTKGSIPESAKTGDARTGDLTESSDPWYGFTSTNWGYLNPQ